jgi:hypothetical protein
MSGQLVVKMCEPYKHKQSGALLRVCDVSFDDDHITLVDSDCMDRILNREGAGFHSAWSGDLERFSAQWESMETAK